MTALAETKARPSPILVAVATFNALLPEPLQAFPLAPKQKIPLIKTGFKAATADPEQLSAWAAEHPDANVGAVPGWSGCVVIDIDNEDARASARLMGLYSEPTLAVRTGRENGGEHLWFRKPDSLQGKTIGNLTLPGGLTVRADNGYCVMPPSVHPSGKPYEIVAQVPPAECPPRLENALRRAMADLLIGGADEQPLVEMGSAMRQNGTALSGPISGRTARLQITDDPIPQGERHEKLVKYAAQLAGRGLKLSEIMHLLDSWTLRVMPTLEDREREIHNAATSAVQKFGKVIEAGAEVGDMVDLLNRKYAFVRSQNAVMRQLSREGEVQLLSVGDLKNAEANLPRMARGKNTISAVDAWLTSPNRREYESLVFAPPPVQLPEGSYNLFRGWMVRPNPDMVPQRFLDHVAEVVADGDEDLFAWVMGWLAHIVQTPGIRTGTSLVLVGQQGTGKTLVGEAMGQILGPARVVASQMSRLIGRFNSHMGYCLLAQAEEAFWGGDRTAEGALKDLVTGRERLVEWKGHEPITMQNYTRLLVTSNQDRVIPAAFDQRRWAVLRVSGKYRGNRDYFRKVFDEIMSPEGAGALLHYLLNLDLSDIPITHAPATDALREQKEESADPIQSWWMQCLHDAHLPGEAPASSASGTTRSGSGVDATASERTIGSLFASYMEYCKQQGNRYPGNAIKFSREIKRFDVLLTPNAESIVWRTTLSGKRVKCWAFHPLTECRKKFEQLIGHKMQWEVKESEWLPADAPEDQPGWRRA